MPITAEGLGIARDFVARVEDAGTMGEQLRKLAAGKSVTVRDGAVEMTRDQVVGSWAKDGAEVVGALWARRQVKGRAVEVTIQRMVIDSRWRRACRPSARVREGLWDALWRQAVCDSEGLATTFSLASVECVLKYKPMWVGLFGAAAGMWEGTAGRSAQRWGNGDAGDPPRLKLSI